MSENEITERDESPDGLILLYRRRWKGKENLVWQAKIKTPSSKGRIRISTKAINLEDAKRIARTELLKAEARVQEGLPLNRIRFDRAALEYKNWLEGQRAQGNISSNKLTNHIKTLDGALTPFFCDKFVHSINATDIDDYYGQRKRIGATRTGVNASKGTLNRDNAVLRGVFNHCMRKGYIQSIPLIENKKAFVRRPSFTIAEAEKIQRKLDEWVDEVHRHDAYHVYDYRVLFRLYCMVIYYTGIRPGLEMASIRWDSVQYKSVGDQEYVKLEVITSKQKHQEIVRRGVIGMPHLKPYLEMVRESHLYNENGYIFAHPTSTQLSSEYVGKPIGSFQKQWKAFISRCDLRKEKTYPYRRRTLYSLRHLYFEQRLINSDVKLHALATNAGTSPNVIMKWYQEVQAEQYAESLSGLIEAENN